jgi:hypothetical protein
MCAPPFPTVDSPQQQSDELKATQALLHQAALKRDGRTGSKRLVDPKAKRLAPFQKVGS